MQKVYKSGFVSIIGRPNVGKSTLLNSLVGEKIAIISQRPQTTRNKIQGILTTDNSQIIFIDTPGMHKPKNKLGEYMVKSITGAMGEVDLILLVIDADKQTQNLDIKIVNDLSNVSTPVILVINKIDEINKNEILPLVQRYQEMFSFKAIIPISALENDGIDLVKDEIIKILPEGPMFFPDDMITDQPEKQIVSELIREKILRRLSKEVPHGIAVEITLMKVKPEIVEINANIYCEKDSHKAIIIGKNGEMLKKIGTSARHDIERFLGMKVFIQLWVKVKKDWRNSEYLIKEFGYK